MQFLKVNFYLQLLWNIGFISHFGEFILEPVLHPPSPPFCPSLSDPYYGYWYPLVCFLYLWVCFFFVMCVCVCVYVCVCKSFQLCLTLRDPMDHSPPGSSVYGILWARILEWISMPSSRRSSDPGIELVSLMSPALSGGFFTISLLSFFFFFFNWSRADLQCCVSFRCTAKWFSYTYINICSFSDSFPM